MTVKLTKRMRRINETIQEAMREGTSRDVLSILSLLKNLSTVKFIESVDVSVNLGVDVRKSDQIVRGSVLLPKGTGRTVRVAVFAQGANADTAIKAGAEIVGFEDLAQKIKAGNIDFDVLVATPDAMPVVGQLGAILGPRGLMPNPKVGTVTTDVANTIQNFKKGQVQYRTDKNGVIHCRIGSVSFSPEDLKENLVVLITELRKAKPGSSKGVYFRKIVVSTTMGPGLEIDPTSL